MSKITLKDFAIMTTSYQQYTFDYTLDSIQKVGIKNVDFWGGNPHYYCFDYNESERKEYLKEIVKKANDRGLKFVIYTPETLNYPYSICDINQKTNQRTIDYFSQCMDDALALGTNRLFINTGTGLRDVDPKQSMDTCINSIAKICEQANSKGVTMLLEQLQPYESNLTYNIEGIKKIVEAVNSPALKICVDLVAMEVAGENLELYYDTFGEEMIQFIHYSDAHHEVCGSGNFPLKEYIKTLEKHNYSSIIDLEINDSMYWMDPHTPHQQSVDYLRTFIPEE